MKRCPVRPSIRRTNLDKDVLWRLLGILYKDIEVAVTVEDACVQEFIFHLAPVAPFASCDQVIIRKGSLRVFVEVLHVGMGRRAVEIEVVLFYILAVIALTVRQSEETLF